MGLYMDTYTKHDRIGDRIQRKRITQIRNFTIYAFLGLLIISFVQNAVEAKAETIIAVPKIETVLEEGCEYQKYYSEYPEGSFERENAYANQMAGIYKVICL